MGGDDLDYNCTLCFCYFGQLIYNKIHFIVLFEHCFVLS